MAEHRLNFTLHTDPTLVAYVGVADGPQRRWERVGYGGGRHVTLADGSTVTLRSDTPYVVTWSDGGLRKSANTFEPLPAAVVEASARTAQLEQSIRDAFATVPCPHPRRLTDATRDVRVNPRLYGEWTWFECRQERFAEFTHEQVAVVVGYLRWKSVRDAILRRDIDEALRNYWAASHRVACPRRLPR